MKTITIKLTDGTTVKTSATKLAELKIVLKKVRENNSAHMSGGNPVFTGYAFVKLYETFEGELDFNVEVGDTFYTEGDMRVNNWKRCVALFNSAEEEEDFCR